MSPGLPTEKTSEEQTVNNAGSHQSIQLQTDVANSEPEVLEQTAAVACVIEDNSLEEHTGATILKTLIYCYFIMFNRKKLSVMLTLIQS